MENRHYSCIVGVKLQAREMVSLYTVVRPKEHAAKFLAQVDRETSRIKARNHH
jgi:hypothetical protein